MSPSECLWKIELFNPNVRLFTLQSYLSVVVLRANQPSLQRWDQPIEILQTINF